MSSELPTVDVFVNYEDPLESLKEIVKVVKPEWDLTKVKYEDKSTGYINKNIKVFVQGLDDAIIVRCISKGFDPAFITFQQSIHLFADQAELGPKVLCNFQNGIAVEFLRGKILSWNDMGEEMYADSLWPKTAETMAKWHSKAVHQKAVELQVPDKSDKELLKVLIPPINALKNSDPESEFCKALPGGEEVVAEFDWFDRTAMKLTPEKRLVHMDPNPTNWVIGDNSTILIDYDATGIFYPSADVAWYFLLHSDFRKPDSRLYPSVEHQRKWIRHYLTKRKQLDDEATEKVTDDMVEKFREEVDVGLLFALMQCTFAGMIVLMMTQKTGRDELKPEVVLTRWRSYKELKAKYVNKGFV